MKFKDYLQEEYHTILKSKVSKKPFEVFENPSGKEITEVGRVDGSIRWIANLPVRKVFIWPGHGDLHENVIKDLDPPLKFSESIFGVGIPKAGKISIPPNNFNADFTILPKDININDWDFADFYFEGGFKNLIKKRAAISSLIKISDN